MDDVVKVWALIPKGLYSVIEGEAVQNNTSIEVVVQDALQSFFSVDGRQSRIFKNISILDDALSEPVTIEVREDLVIYLFWLSNRAFRQGVFRPDVVYEIVKRSKPLGKLDVRFAIDLLETCGRVAEVFGDNEITLRHLLIGYRHLLPF